MGAGHHMERGRYDKVALCSTFWKKLTQPAIQKLLHPHTWTTGLRKNVLGEAIKKTIQVSNRNHLCGKGALFAIKFVVWAIGAKVTKRSYNGSGYENDRLFQSTRVRGLWFKIWIDILLSSFISPKKSCLENLFFFTNCIQLLSQGMGLMGA